MYICQDCGTVFSTPERCYAGLWEMACCPQCDGNNYKPAGECAVCGTDISEDEPHGLCPVCRDNTRRVFQTFLNSFTDEQLAFLTDAWEGDAFERSTK